uniref:G-protein coupled receptors family 1 profile domain-containing protein n=1 Tax=Scleropages formosus TaxID=113540 RepID=A0A8C9U9K5_SCLFO
MSEYAARNISHTDFILSGFSGPKEWKQLLFIPFFLLFVMSITANSMIIFIILSHRALHSPMYLLICVMAFVDLVIPIFFVPNMLLNLLFNWNHISLMGCLVQMFCIHFFQSVQSTVLLWMALDRFYAICTPLHYNEHMRFSAFLKFVIIPMLRNAVFISAIVAADVLFIVVSYVRIFVSLFKSGRSCQKAFSTCITHIIVMFVGLIFALTSFLSYRIKNDMSFNSHMVISTMYLLVQSIIHRAVSKLKSTAFIN